MDDDIKNAIIFFVLGILLLLLSLFFLHRESNSVTQNKRLKALNSISLQYSYSGIVFAVVLIGFAINLIAKKYNII